MVKKIIDGMNEKGEQCKTKVYDGENTMVSYVIGGSGVVIRDKNSAQELKIDDPKSIGELRRALNEICNDKAII
jgi:hypothetical protein